MTAIIPHPHFTDTTQTSADGHFTVFTGDRQSAFLENLQLFGNVRNACKAACVSAQTAYRARRNSRGFRLAWDAALLAARGHAEATLADRAINGIEEVVFYHGEEVGRRRRHDSRLLLAHLARLDRLEERAEIAEMLERLDECIEGLKEGGEIDDILTPDAVGEGEGDSLPQDSVPGVPSCRNAQEPEAAHEECEDAGEPELEQRLRAMEAARPLDAPTVYEQATAWADSGSVEAAQLLAFEAGEARWWDVVPADPDCSSTTHATGVSTGLPGREGKGLR